MPRKTTTATNNTNLHNSSGSSNRMPTSSTIYSICICLQAHILNAFHFRIVTSKSRIYLDFHIPKGREREEEQKRRNGFALCRIFIRTLCTNLLFVLKFSKAFSFSLLLFNERLTTNKHKQFSASVSISLTLINLCEIFSVNFLDFLVIFLILCLCRAVWTRFPHSIEATSGFRRCAL